MSKETIEARGAAIYSNLIDEIDMLYTMAVKAGVDPEEASKPAHRACGSALALRLDITNAYDAARREVDAIASPEFKAYEASKKVARD